MSSIHIHLIFILGVFTITEQRNQPVAEIEDLLDYLAQKQSKSSIDEPLPALQRKLERLLQDEDRDLNVQTHFFNHNSRNKQDDDEDNALRLDNDRICRITGRCGCNGARCGEPSREDRSLDVDRILEQINKELDENEGYYNNRQENDSDYDEDLTLQRNSDKHERDDDLDIVLLEVPDAEDKLIINKLQDLGDDLKIVDLRDVNLLKILLNRQFTRTNKAPEAYLKGPNPEDLFMSDEIDRKDKTNTILEYIKGRTDDTYLNNLTPFQRKHNDHSQDKQSKRQIFKDIVKKFAMLIFGTDRGMKLLPHSKDRNIYVPQNLYDAIKNFADERESRYSRGLFPLTLNQKKKQQKTKQLSNFNVKNISKQSRRRNLQQHSDYGVPFDLEIQGLGQIN